MLFSDNDIRELISTGEMRITDDVSGEWDISKSAVYEPSNKDAVIQAASVDLSVGSIYVPAKSEDSALQPLSEHILEPGATAVVKNSECLELPNHVGGILFPVSRAAARGLLLVNPGHVDPGYAGHLDFTVINMSRKPFPIARGDKFATLLLFQLTSQAAGPWLVRYPQVGNPANAIATNRESQTARRLSRDFLAIKDRAKTEAKEQIRNAAWVVSGILMILTALVTVSGVLASNYFQDRSANSKRIEQLDGALSEVKDDASGLQQRITDLEREVTQPTQPSPSSRRTP
ncbi:dCTP deaminase [Streptomyces violaceus]